ncbi:DUF4097 family beta strand repeat-containing protein [Actinoplanes rectilineatus]|uniref:DUF4097 family beta strand repeat-containing protein n=1 Tax=Actinoplanes rectilineatus TaxID=113571 RepID=UPI0005F2C51D|nr:DUF4097 family beta strand repeat-containing protein [Actinoplanes rectilineatus]
MAKVNHTARLTGPVTLNIDTGAADVMVVADPSVTGTWIELSTEDESGPSVDAIREARFYDDGAEVSLKLTEPSVSFSTGGMTFSNIYGGGMIFGNGGTIRVNGQVVTGGTTIGGSKILVRAITETGSAVKVETVSGDVMAKNVRVVRAETVSGDVTTLGVDDVRAKTTSGNIDAVGVTASSRLKSVSGDIMVSGEPGTRVTAKTTTGDVSSSGGVDLDASSVSGRVNGQCASTADEWW